MRESDNTTRRAVLMGVGVSGLVTVLAACGSGAAESGPAESASTTAEGASGALGATSDIPVGGGKVFADRRVVVVQPEEGTFKAFSAVCTHQGCLIDAVRDGAIVCPCHRSAFAIADGSVQGGPATRPLDEVKIDVSDGQITLA